MINFDPQAQNLLEAALENADEALTEQQEIDKISWVEGGGAEGGGVRERGRGWGWGLGRGFGCGRGRGGVWNNDKGVKLAKTVPVLKEMEKGIEELVEKKVSLIAWPLFSMRVKGLCIDILVYCTFVCLCHYTIIQSYIVQDGII